MEKRDKSAERPSIISYNGTEKKKKISFGKLYNVSHFRENMLKNEFKSLQNNVSHFLLEKQ